MNINEYMDNGIKSIVSNVKAFYNKNPKGLLFLVTFANKLNKSMKTREKFEKEGIHVPPFLIASISSTCNLHCQGCYARAQGLCNDEKENEQMSTEDWNRLFTQAGDMGVSFIILAGGEPLLKKDIIMSAANYKNIAFPIFTNGMLITKDYIDLFDQNRNLVPVISIEGSAEQTDNRRGEGVSDIIDSVIKNLTQRKILFAVSVTVTSENYKDVTSEEFVNSLRKMGCGIIFYVEYVPIQKGTDNLVLDEDKIQYMDTQVKSLKTTKKDMAILSFPGDEKYMGGCLSAGRGFFHINPNGGAEPCPFSPYSKLNFKKSNFKELLVSPFFKQVRGITANAQHNGGCTLYTYEEDVKKL